MQKKMALTDIHRCLLNVYGDQAVDVSTVRGRWCISAVGSDNGLPLLVQTFTPLLLAVSVLVCISESSDFWLLRK